MIGTRVFAEILQPEAFLAFFSTGAIWCLVEARSFDELEIDIHASRSRWYLLFWVFLALGALSKGLHGALWPLGGALLTAAVFPSTRYWLRRIAGLAGFGIFLLITLPWYIYMTLRWPGFLTEHFWNEQLRTAASVRFPLYNLKVPFFAFLLHQLIAMLPWSLGLPAAVWFAIKKKSQLHGADKDIVALLAMTFLLEAASLSFSSRFTYYGVSAWGWVAGFLALPWRDDPVWCRWSNRIYLILPGAMVLFAAIFYLGLANKYATQPFEVIVSGIRDSELKSLFVLSPSLFSSPLFATGCLGVLLLLGGVFIGCFWYKNQPFSMLVATAISMLAPFAFVSFALNKISPFDSLARAAQVINQRIVPKTNPVVVWAGDPDACSSLFVYLNTRPHYLDAQFDREYAQRVLGLGRDFYLQDKDFIRLWNSQRPVYLICTGPRWRYWQAGGLLSDHVHEIYNAGNYVVVTNSGPGAN
jgi:MFS family permease